MAETKVTGIERGRAKFAYECAEKGNKLSKKKEYKAYTKKIPMMIKTNGLGATFAFIKSKASSDEKKAGYAYQLIYKQMADWLKKDDKKLVDLSGDNDFVGEIVKLESPQYRALTIEVLAFFNWLRRFAEGLIGDEEPPNARR